MNGIPVLGSRNGGIPEAIGPGGVTLDTPESCGAINETEKWLTLPSEEECRPWADALYALFDHAAEWQDRCAEAARTNSLKVRGDRLMELFAPLLARRAGDGDFSRMGSIFYQDDPLDWEPAGRS